MLASLKSAQFHRVDGWALRRGGQGLKSTCVDECLRPFRRTGYHYLGYVGTELAAFVRGAENLCEHTVTEGWNVTSLTGCVRA